jgi:hypothetical protein
MVRFEKQSIRYWFVYLVRFWLFRAGLLGFGVGGGLPARWFVHGLFA